MPRGSRRDHVDAIHRARFDAEVAASTLRFDDRVHSLRSSQYGVNRTGLYALRTADAFILAYYRHTECLEGAVGGVEFADGFV